MNTVPQVIRASFRCTSKKKVLERVNTTTLSNRIRIN